MALDLNNLNGPQRRIVRDAFLASFDEAKLDMLLQDYINKKPLATLVAPASFQVMVFHLINVSRQEGWTDQLLAAAEQASNNARIRELRQTLETSEAINLTAIDNQVNVSSPASGGLERIVREDGGFADWGLWVSRMTEIERQICRIEYPVGLNLGGGTGFLVARDLVLTNYHVIEKHEKNMMDFSHILCRFDFAVGADANTPVKLDIR